MDNKYQPAYPVLAVREQDCMGLTKREMFAMAAMQGMLSNGNLETWMDLNEIPSLAVKAADELLNNLTNESLQNKMV
jgi:hypothetical protein